MEECAQCLYLIGSLQTCSGALSSFFPSLPSWGEREHGAFVSDPVAAVRWMVLVAALFAWLVWTMPANTPRLRAGSFQPQLPPKLSCIRCFPRHWHKPCYLLEMWPCGFQGILGRRKTPCGCGLFQGLKSVGNSSAQHLRALKNGV